MYLVRVLSEAIPIASRQTLKSGQPFTGFIQKPYHAIVWIRWDLGRSGGRLGQFGCCMSKSKITASLLYSYQFEPCYL